MHYQTITKWKTEKNSGRYWIPSAKRYVVYVQKRHNSLLVPLYAPDWVCLLPIYQFWSSQFLLVKTLTQSALFWCRINFDLVAPDSAVWSPRGSCPSSRRNSAKFRWTCRCASWWPACTQPPSPATQSSLIRPCAAPWGRPAGTWALHGPADSSGPSRRSRRRLLPLGQRYPRPLQKQFISFSSHIFLEILHCPTVFGHFLDPLGNHPRGPIFPTVG